MTTPTFTVLDSLKECAARGHFTLRWACKLLDLADMLAPPYEVEALRFELDQLREVLTEAIHAHVPEDDEHADYFSDGRPIVTAVSLGSDGAIGQPWSADPTSWRDQPRIAREFRVPSGTQWRIAILRPGEVDAVAIHSKSLGYSPD
ncbi:hypothetical protein H7J86_03505 [Mycobacterium hackensackense]|uniref:hypothetical protein n=1 Tax=Mycobacterium hackensackense TaxID=228909 RepID=UPI00226587BD|nr:hypothetical protein [Mycobacterium hackensackense]MCV7251218.1 hypothetical protein [Mycobacterium hackensackense]